MLTSDLLSEKVPCFYNLLGILNRIIFALNDLLKAYHLSLGLCFYHDLNCYLIHIY